ncbi:MAG: hypothetical protein V4579_07915 [Pseudomonadota bacterium]
MIQPAAPTVASNTATGAAAAPASIAECRPNGRETAADTAVFAEVLAQQQDAAGAASSVTRADDAPVTDPLEAKAAERAAKAAMHPMLATLQSAGKSLPVAGKPAPARAQAPEDLDETGNPAGLVDADVAALLITGTVAMPAIPAALPAKPAAHAPETPAGDTRSSASTQPAPLLPEPQRADAQFRGQSLAQGAPDANPETAPPDPAQAAAPGIAIVIERAAAPATFILIDQALPQGSGTLHLRPVLAPKNEYSANGSADLTVAAPDNGAAGAGASPVAAPAGGEGPALPAAPGRPAGHDFAALVDRLIAARDASQPGVGQGNVQVAVQHADFGQVSLSFQQDTDGLSVSATSADPDFARAVQAATASSGARDGTDLSSGHPRQSDTHLAGQRQAAFGASQDSPPDGRQARARNVGRTGDGPAADHLAGPAGTANSVTRRGVFA